MLLYICQYLFGGVMRLTGRRANARQYNKLPYVQDPKGLTTTTFSEKFKEIREMGYVSSQRKGPTGIGYTLETLLGINENNDAFPDIEGAELKAHRANSSSLITLFTFNKKFLGTFPRLLVLEKWIFDLSKNY